MIKNLMEYQVVPLVLEKVDFEYRDMSVLIVFLPFSFVRIPTEGIKCKLFLFRSAFQVKT